MADDNRISGKVGLDITDFRTGVADLNRQIRVIETGFKAAAAGTEDWTRDADALRARIGSLNQVIDLQRQKVEATRAEYQRVAAEKGETSKAAQDLAVKLNRETEALNRSETNLKKTEQSLRDVTRESDRSAEAIDRMGKATDRAAGVAKAAMAAVAAAAAAAGAAVLGFAQKGLQLASDLEEVQNVVDVTFGPEGSGKIDQWAKDAAQSFGMSELQAKQFNGTMGAMLKSMGLTGDEVLTMSQSLSGLAGDFASFYNLDSEDAFAKIRAGISGETEPLKQLGINMSVANLEAYALSQGLTTAYSSMTQAEQAALRYNYLLSVSADAQGDFARTSDSYANQQRILSLELENLSSAFGSKLLPAATEAIRVLIEGIQNIDPAVFDTLVQQLSAMAVSMAEAAVELIPKIVDFISFVMENGNELTAIIVAIGAGMVAWNVVAIIQGVIAAVKTWQAATQGMSIAQKALNLVMAANPVGLVITAIAALAAGIIYLWNTNEGFRKAVIKAWEGIQDSVLGAIDKVRETVSSWKQLGSDIIDGIKEGVITAAKRLVTAVVDAVKGALKAAKNFLGINSPSRLFQDEIGLNIGYGMASGIAASAQAVNAAMADLNRQLVADARITVSPAAPAAGRAAAQEAQSQTTIVNNNTFVTRTPAENARELEILTKKMAAVY